MEILRYSLEKSDCFLCASHTVPDGNIARALRSFCHWKGRQPDSFHFLSRCAMLPRVTGWALLSTSKPTAQRHVKMKNSLIGKPCWLFSLGHSLLAGHLLPASGPYRNVECLPEREMLLPTGEGKLLPRCRSSIDRLQGLDLSMEFSTLFSKLSKSKLQGNRNSKAGLDSKDAQSASLPVKHLQT